MSLIDIIDQENLSSDIVYKSSKGEENDVRYTKIEMKKIKYLQSPGRAIYFQDVTSWMKQMQLEC